MRFTRRNLRSIKRRFEEQTGVDLAPDRPSPPPLRKLVLLAAVVACGLVLAAFTYPLFTPLRGDELSLSAAYEGDGIVSVFIENGSDRDLEFQKQLKLMRWLDGQEVEPLGGKVLFENTFFPAHSSGTMTLDLSRAYDLEALEHPQGNPQWYYLLLTNNGFLFGHDWMCSVDFAGIPQTEPEDPSHVAAAAESREAVEEALRFYFEDAYSDEVAGLNEQNFRYLQKVEEVIQRFDGQVVSPVYPTILVTGPSTTLDPNPRIDQNPKNFRFDDTLPQEQQEQLVNVEWKTVDGYGRLVGGAMREKALTVSAVVPLSQGETTVPLIYTFVYEAAAVQDPDSYAFLYGRFLSFGELAEYKVYEDEFYVIYEVTDLFYTDLEAYLDYLAQARPELVLDASIRTRIQRIYQYYKDPENLGQAVFYLPGESR